MNCKTFAILFINLVIFTCSIQAQESKKQLDKAAIKAMVGCYNVEFKYTETFAPEVDYEQAYDYTSAAFEWAELVEETDDKIVIQHLLIINDSTIIKHWRQDWVYEADRAFTYDKNNRWLFSDTNPETSNGKWTQKVYQVDDSPRYCGTATWTHVDGVSSWFNKADSPLPRREYSKRDDYNVMKRGNRVIITEDGWLHEQDNDKVIREDMKEDVLLVQEKGYNTYKRTNNKDCHAAQEWWLNHSDKWSEVREIWEDVYKNEVVELHVTLDDKRLYEHLFYGINDLSRSEIEDIINRYTVKSEGL